MTTKKHWVRNPNGPPREAAEPTQFKAKDPANPLVKTISFRVSEREFATWQSDRSQWKDAFRAMLKEKGS